VQTEAGYFRWASTDVLKSIFRQNSASQFGGAIFAINQRIYVENNSFVSNIAGEKLNLFTDIASSGGAIWYSSSFANSYIENCLFEENLAYGGWGGAVFITGINM